MRSLVPVAALAFTALVQPARAEERRFTIGGFERLRVEGPVEVVVASGAQPMALAEGDGRALSSLDVKVRGNTLTIRRQRRQVLEEARRLASEPPALPRVFIDARSVNAVTLVGPGKVRLDRLAGETASVTLDGPGDLEVGAVDAADLSVSFSGSGTMSLEGGTAQRVAAVLVGLGNVEAAGLSIGALDLTTEGFVEGRFTVRDNARIGAAGETRIKVLGSPRCDVRQVGRGSVRCGEPAP